MTNALEKPGRYRLCAQISLEEKKRIELRVKKEYPKLRNVSELVRAALTEFLQEE